MYEIFEKLLEKHGLTAYRVAKDTGITTATLTSWKQGKYVPKQEKLQKIADYFGVPVDYLKTGEEAPEKNDSPLTKRDERDIAKDLNNIMKKIKTGEDGPLHYNGEEIDPESLSLLEDAIKLSLKQLKIINKEKYNPNKNKK